MAISSQQQTSDRLSPRGGADAGAPTPMSQSEGMALVGQVAGGILHDFNNVLTVITGTIDILAHAVADRPELAAVARLIDEAASRGARLTSQLLAFAQGRPPQPCRVDIDELLTDAGRLLRPTLGTQIEITTQVATETPAAFADAGQLLAALLCLGIAAGKSMPEGGSLRFEAGRSETIAAGRRASNCVVISLRADAAGVSSRFVSQIGMVDDFVRRSNGGLTVEEPAGPETRVEISLPRADTGLHG